MTDIILDKNQILYKQNDDSEYIYFCMEGICDKYSYVSFKWKKQFIDYISDFNSNFFLRANTIESISYLRLMKLINEAKKCVPPSPFVFRNLDFGKFNLSCKSQKDINELILQKDDKFSDPYDLFKVSLSKITDNDILGLEEVTEFKRRFTTIKVTSDFAHLKRIKAIDFFKVFINNSSNERDDDLILNYICEKKRMLVKQIELLCKYKKSKQIKKYIEEYNKCYNSINTKQKRINKKMHNYINSLSKMKKQYQKSKNIFLRKIYKLKSAYEINNLYKSDKIENQKNEQSDSPKIKSNSKLNINSKNNLRTSKIYLYQRNLDDLDFKFKFDSPKSKFSSFSPSTKNQTIAKLKDDSNAPNNNKSLSFSSNLSKSNLTLTNNNLTKFNKKQNFFSLSIDKSINENSISNQPKKSRNIKIKEDKFLSFNIEEYKKNLYCKYGFFINEIIKLGLGPNIPLRRHLTKLNNDINLNNNKNSIESFRKNKKGIKLEKEVRKRRYEFLKITELS